MVEVIEGTSSPFLDLLDHLDHLDHLDTLDDLCCSLHRTASSSHPICRGAELPLNVAA